MKINEVIYVTHEADILHTHLLEHSSEYRTGLIKYWDLFKHDVPVVFDDVHRVHDWKVMRGIAARLRKPYIVPTPWEGKQWGVVL